MAFFFMGNPMESWRRSSASVSRYIEKVQLECKLILGREENTLFVNVQVSMRTRSGDSLTKVPDKLCDNDSEIEEATAVRFAKIRI